MSARADLRTALTDRGAIGPALPGAVGLVVAADQVLGLGALGLVPTREVPLSTRLAVMLGGVAVLTVLLAIARMTWLRPARIRRPIVVLATVVIGAQVGLTLSARWLTTLGLTGAERTAGPGEVVLLAAVTVATMVALGVLARHRTAMAQLATASAELRAARASGEDALRAERSQLRAHVRVLLEDRLGATSARPSPYAPAQLRALADEVLRPLSHQLARTTTGFEPGAPAPSPRTRWSDVARALRPEPVVRPRLLTAVMAVLTFRLTVAARPPGPATAPPPPGQVRVTVDWTSFGEAVLLQVAVLAVVLGGTRILAGRLDARARTEGLAARWSVVVGALAALGLGSLVLLRALHRLPGFGMLPPVDARTVLGFTAPFLVVTGVVSLLEAAAAALDDVRDAAARANAEVATAVARVNGALLQERRGFARHLHASVQAAVNAACILIERATVDGRSDPAVVDRAARIIDEAVAGLLATTDTATALGTASDAAIGGADDLEERLAAVRTTWSDVADVRTDIDASAGARLAADAVARATVCDLIAEACANAVVHGGAGRVDVTVRDAGTREVVLVVADDGTAEHARRRADRGDVEVTAGGGRRVDGGAVGGVTGLGSAALTAACSWWTLERTPEGTRLSAAVPVA